MHARPLIDHLEEAMRIVALIVLLGFAAGASAARPDWVAVGENANGNKVSFDKASIKKSGHVVDVTYRTELRVPLDSPGGGIKVMRSRMKVDCKAMTAAGIEVVLYEDEAKGKVFSRNKAAKIEYLKEPSGGSADLVMKKVCG
jgi:hypothetical protein